MTPGPPFSLQGLTFSVLGSTGTHLWDHPGAPERPFGTTLANLRNQTPKKRKTITFLGPVLEPKLNAISWFFYPCFYTRSERRKWGPNVAKYEEKGCRNYIVNNKSQIEKLRFDWAGASGSRVKAPRNRQQINKKRHANENSTRTWFSMKSIPKTGQISIDFDNSLRRFCMSFSGPAKELRAFSKLDSRRGHLGHISDKGGTGRHSKRPWGSRRLLEAITAIPLS